MLDIRFSTLLDMNNIMNFIDNHWKKNHILSKDKNLFLYEYQDENIINFVIAIDDKNNIYGILGFIKSSNINSDIWLAMWKAVRHDNHPMLGVELLEYLRSSNKYNRLTCPGINIKVIPIYNYLGFYTDSLNQFVIINNKIKTFNILKIKDAIYSRKLNFIENTKYSLTEIEENQLNFNFKNVVVYSDLAKFLKSSHLLIILTDWDQIKNCKYNILLNYKGKKIIDPYRAIQSKKFIVNKKIYSLANKIK